MKKFLLSIFAAVAAFGVSATDVTFDYAKPAELNPAQTPTEYDSQGTGVTISDVVFTAGDVTMVTTKGSTDARLWTLQDGATQMRLYKGATITFKVTEGNVITKIVLNSGNTNFNTLTVTPGEVAFDDKVGTWTGKASTVVFTAPSNAKTMQINSVVVSYEAGEGGDTPETPVDPTPSEGNVLYESLKEADATCDWTIDETVWSWKGYNDKYYLNASAFGKDEAIGNTYYAVSPVIDLSEAKSAFLTFDHAAKFQTTLRTLCGAVVRLEGATEWTALTIPAWPEAGAWTFASSGDIDLSAYVGKKIQLGFKYGSSDAGADTWEIKNLKISGEGSAVNPPVDPVDPTPGDESTKENPHTVAQAIALGMTYNKAAWVKGFIVGYVNGQAYADGCVFGNTAAEGAEVSKTNILIADSKDETDINNCMPVQLPAGTVRDALNLNTNPANLGKELTINAYITKYFNVPGLKKDGDATYEYVLDGQGSEPVNPPVVEKAKFVKAAAIESGKKYLLVADGKAATGKVKNDAAYGYLLVEAVTIEGDVASAPADYGFTISAVEGAYTIQRPDGTYVAMKGTYNSFNFYASPEEWYEWVISINNDGTADIWNSDADKYVAYDAQYSSYGCYPEEKAETCIKPTLYVLDESQSGVVEIVIDENAPVEYFNIQGVKVDVENAAPGLYIRRQGNVATKVIVK